DPVNGDLSTRTAASVFTGCPAFAGHDESEASVTNVTPSPRPSPLRGEGAESYAWLATASHMAPNCFSYPGQIFSWAILRKASTLAAFTVMPLGSSSSLALAKLSTLSVS